MPDFLDNSSIVNIFSSSPASNSKPMLILSPIIVPAQFGPLDSEPENFLGSLDLANQQSLNFDIEQYPLQANSERSYLYSKTFSSAETSIARPRQVVSPNYTSPPRKSIQKYTCRNVQDKGFKCLAPNCGKVFSKKWNLQAHKRIHTGSKPFKCRLGCGEQYMWLSSLKGHELRRCPLLPESEQRKTVRRSKPSRPQDTSFQEQPQYNDQSEKQSTCPSEDLFTLEKEQNQIEFELDNILNG